MTRDYANTTANLDAAEEAATLGTAGLSGVAVQLSGTFVGTVTFEGTVDNTNWVSVNSVTPTGTISTTATAAGVYLVNCSAYSKVRARCSAYTSGTIVTYIQASDDGATTTPTTALSTTISGLLHAEDDAHTSTDDGVQTLSVRQDAAAALGGTDGDYQPLITDANGRLHVLDENSAAVLADTAAIQTAVEIVDDWDESDRAKVNPIVGQAGIAAGAGAVGVTVPRVTLASDDPAVADLAAIELLNTDIETNTDSLAVVGGGAEATAVRVTLANDSTGLVSVDDNSSSLTVDNTSIDGPGSPTIDSYTHAAINLTTGNDQVLASSAASKQIWVYGYAFTCGDADGQTVSLQDEDDTAITGVMEFSRYGGVSVSPSGNFAMPVFKLATDKDLEVDITGGDVDGWIAYAVVSV